MKQVVQNYKSGELALLDVPEPACKPGGLLVRSRFSLISAGTELMKVEEAKLSLVGKARARPDQVKKVLETVATQGPTATYRKVMNRLDSYTPLGYSLCGEVIEVGAGVEGFTAGDLVACAGNEHALHAEVNWVPVNLCVPVPEAVEAEHAAFATVGAIALQGVRRGEPQLGDVALVIGLGLIGQLVVQLLGAAGAVVVGVDPSAERCALAEQLGASAAGAPGSQVVVSAVQRLSDGHGVDQVYLAAGGATNEPVELAAALARDRARVVDIGKCKLDLPWNAYYDKELEVRFSRSYGPGRYDPLYELEGIDYPIGYVRWTERRNLSSFLDLVGAGRIDLGPMVSHVARFEDAVATYQAMHAGELRGIGVLFRYSEADARDRLVAEPAPRPRRSPGASTGAKVRVGFVGAGNYASSMLLPHLAERDDVALAHVATSSALSATNAKTKFGFAHASTDVDALLADDGIDAIFVVTRHSSHAALVNRVLEAGKACFVEKPLAIDEPQLASILATVDATGNDRLQVGFNRRFAPLLTEARERFGRRIGPAVARYLVNAGPMEASSWYARADSEGSRFVGEGCHFVDTVSWWLGADPVSVYALATPGDDDNVQAILGYPDGSTAAITYTTTGDPRFPKETFEVVADAGVMRLDDFRKVSVHRSDKWSAPRIPAGRDKGQKAEVAAFVDAVRTGGPMPISLASLAATTRATLAVGTSLGTGAPVEV